jgi:hypothetical protein
MSSKPLGGGRTFAELNYATLPASSTSNRTVQGRGAGQAIACGGTADALKAEAPHLE